MQPTSTDALASLKINPLQLLVYAAIAERHGATDEEIQSATGLNPSTQRPRRIELVARKLVRDSGETRPTKSGRRAIVWVVAEQAVEAA